MGAIRAEDINSTAPVSGSIIAAITRRQPGEDRIALILYHRDGAEVVPLSAGAPVVVGRAPPSQVRIADHSLSREHARFTLLDGVVLLEDLRSTNGTWVGGQRVARAELRPGDELILGSVIGCVRMVTPEESALHGLMSHERFRVALEDEVVRARYFGRGLSLIMVRAGRGVAGLHVSRWSARVRGLLRPVDRAALYSSGALAILLAEAGAEAAVDFARAITASPAAGEPPLLAGVASFPDAARDAEQLLELCWGAAQAATSEQPVQRAPGGAWTLRGAPEGRGAAEDLVIVGPAMHSVMNAVARLARSPIPVLIYGETGTGKELVAHALHQRGPRSGHPLVSVNCGAIPPQLVESTLFGHERGAFTGASQQQKGVFEAADGGTVFLDEIGELPTAAQAALLRVLETKRITRVGSSREIPVDVRVVAATHRDLEAMSGFGAFRLDLLYRLNAMTLTLPPLRERVEEIEPLALRFLEQANQANGRRLLGIEPQALGLLQRYRWPGNIRELRNALERAVVIAEGDWVSAADLPERVRAAVSLASSAPPAPAAAPPERASSLPEPAPAQPDAPEGFEAAGAAGGPGDNLKARLQRYEAELIVEALREAGWNQTEAARRLGMPLRTLVHKLKALGIKKLGYGPTDEDAT